MKIFSTLAIILFSSSLFAGSIHSENNFIKISKMGDEQSTTAPTQNKAASTKKNNQTSCPIKPGKKLTVYYNSDGTVRCVYK